MNQRQMKKLIDQCNNYAKADWDVEIRSCLCDRTGVVVVSVWNMTYCDPLMTDAAYLEDAGMFQGRQMIKVTREDDRSETFLIEARAEPLFGLLYT